MRVEVKGELLSWACRRSGLTPGDLRKAFPKLDEWVSAVSAPTFKQLEAFASKTRTPLGYFFLAQPPAEPLPLPDFRTLSSKQPASPSPELLDTIYAMQRRQFWLRERLVEGGAQPLVFVGSAILADIPEAVANEMRRLLDLEEGWAREARTWQDAVGHLRRAIERLGVLAVINGVVGNNTHRVLSVGEFRGFAITDSIAPLLFVNGADAKSAQMFTLIHELAHIWLGAEGLSGFEALLPHGRDVEEWCNKVAAEFLVPAKHLTERWPAVRREASPFELLAREFKVSPIVVARRALDLRLISRDGYFVFYDDYSQREVMQAAKSRGGDFYRNQGARIGEYFARHVFRAAAEGRIGFKEAYELTDLRGEAFHKYAAQVGVIL